MSASAALAQKRLRIDVKTPFSEKADLSVAKLGTTLFLVELQTADVTDVGEDYSLWLRDYERFHTGDVITVKLVVELRMPSAFRTGALIARKTVEVSFRAQDDWSGVNSIRDAAEREIGNVAREAQLEALLVGEKVHSTVRAMLQRVGTLSSID